MLIVSYFHATLTFLIFAYETFCQISQLKTHFRPISDQALFAKLLVHSSTFLQSLVNIYM